VSCKYVAILLLSFFIIFGGSKVEVLFNCNSTSQIFKFDNKQQQAAMAERKSSKKGKTASKKASAQQEIAVPQTGM
jgi:hypothetical protein